MTAEVDEEVEQLSLNDAATHLLEECRMALPGMQALLGFQFIVVFSDGFGRELTRGEQGLHLAALVLVVLSTTLVLGPAALHRQTDRRSISERFLRTSNVLLTASMVPLALAMCLDGYLVARVILRSEAWAGVLAALLLAMLAAVWWWLPRARRAGGQRGAGR